MKLGIFTCLLGERPAEEVFKYVSELGIQTVEIGAGGNPGDAHMKPLDLLADSKKIEDYKEMLKRYNLEISALSVHSNHVHPNKEIAEKAHTDFINACKVAEKLGVDTINTFSGCPGDHPGAKYANWVTCGWPDDYPAILEYQWNDVLIPYWKAAVKEAGEYGIKKIALEMHGGFCVYNVASLLKLRKAVGPEIGTNFDPSHLLWQGADPVAAIKVLKEAIFHFHAKDTRIDAGNTAVNGLLDLHHYGDVLNRSWVFRTVGYGNDYLLWNDIISALKAVGYDGAISIEHEDCLMSKKEGLEKAVKFLKEVIIFEKPGEIWWA